MKTVLQSQCLTLLNEKKVSLYLVKKFGFDPGPESDAEIPAQSDFEFPSKCDPDPEILFPDSKHCL